MNQKKSIITTITGGLTSTAPILFACCKSGACVGVCVSPVASLFGISSATIAASPIISIIEPLLIALSAVSFTISYYSLYVIPKLNCNTANTCDCVPTDKEKRKTKISKSIFWAGLIVSIVALSYFEYQKYQSANTSSCETECSSTQTNTCSDTTACNGQSCGQ